MSTTCQDIISRARSFNTLNSGLTSDSTEMLSRIRADQQRVFTGIAGLTRDRFKTTASLTSSVAASSRTFSLSTTPPLERVLMLTLADGREANLVDELDVATELAPRYFVRGTTLVEVSNDWSATSGAVTATLVYVYGATDIDPTGSLTQTVTVPDTFVDVLVLPLAGYLAQKDPGRDPDEMARLASQLDEAQAALVAYLTNWGGMPSSRFVLPNPLRTASKKA